MDFLWNESASEIYNKPLVDRMRELKETEDGVETMCQFSEELYNEGKTDGEARLASLIQKLLAASRGEDVQKAVSDPEYRSMLYGQYGIVQ